MSKPLKLTPAQQAAAVDRVSENIALQSGAGCGKTFVLARRFTSLLLNSPDVENCLSRLVALTFTDKAAVEMAQRVRSMLRSFAAAAGSQSDRRRLLRWVEQLAEARISTIHSFCASLLRTHAIEAGLDPDFAVCAEPVITDRLLAEAAEEAVLAAVESEDAATADLLATMRFETLVDHARHLAAERARIDLAAYDDVDATMQRWDELLQIQRQNAWRELHADKALSKMLDELGEARCDNAADKLLPIQQDTLEQARRLMQPGQPTAEAFAAVAEISPRTYGSNKSWGGDGAATAVRHQIKAIQAALAEYAQFAEPLNEYDRQAAGTLATLCRLATDAEARYHKTKLARGLIDFTDLMTFAHRLLLNNPKLAAALGDGIDQLLIDEAQDTDVMQLELLMQLLAGGDEPASDLPAMGKLFLVGDAKQSIYRFRGAQVEVFENLCQKLGLSQQVNLDVSFRTLASGVEFVNHVFAGLMDSYNPIRSNRSEKPTRPSVEITLAQPTKNEPFKKIDDCVAAQAVLTAQRIEEMLTGGEKLVWDSEAEAFRPVQPGDIAILFARMTNSLEFERQLQRRDIPYHVVSGMGFYQRQEVYDLLNALRVIDNPFDDISLMGLLRSAMFGLDDNALMHIASTHEKPYLPNLSPDKLVGKLDDAQLASLRLACEILRKLGGCKDAMGIDELLQELLDATGYEATLLGQFQGRRMVGNIRMLLGHARPAGEYISLAEFIRQIEEQIFNETRSEQAPVAGENENVVSIITIHKAKGLEFPVVIVPDLNNGRPTVKGAILNRLDWGLTTKILPGRDEHELADAKKDAENPLTFRLARQHEKTDQWAETIRKYYVALTRHEDYLVLIGADYRSQEGKFKAPGCFMQSLDDVLDITGALEEGRDEVPYGNGEYVARVRRVVPTAAVGKKRDLPPGQVLLQSAGSATEAGQALGFAAAGSESATPPLLGPLPVTTGKIELATTALGDFEQCPMLYHWRYELRAPTEPLLHSGDAEPSPSHAAAGLDPLTLGTLYHRCMELLDFAAPQPAEVLLRQVVEEMELHDCDFAALTGELSDMLETFRASELAGQIAAAGEVYRELDFLTDVGPATIRGQIDLLYNSGGAWGVVDYKSDRVAAGENIAAKAQRYQLQMLIYAAAVAGYTGKPPADAKLYFLRTGQCYTFEITPETLAQARQRVTRLAGQLIAARRTGQFHRCNKDTCSFCHQQHLKSVNP
ncbi:MAG: UvrD-helicase domain-containing protein [Phycisphaerae bacterium]|nr:UvrD-helicase domain-containing protein [Phycisphaerae bacterium]